MRSSGRTLVELLVALLLIAILAAGAMEGIFSVLRTQNFVTTVSALDVDTSTLLTQIASDLREATVCTDADAGCQIGAAVGNASASGFTVYLRDGSGVLRSRTYAKWGSSVTITEPGSSRMIARAGLEVLYFRAATGSPNPANASGLTAYTPTISDGSQLMAMQVTVTISGGNPEVSVPQTAFVRLRNSPAQP